MRFVSALLVAAFLFAGASTSVAQKSGKPKKKASAKQPTKSAPKATRKKQDKKKKKPEPFKWVNQPKGDLSRGVFHKTFRSPSMDADVGYCIYLPPNYFAGERQTQRYPVVYYLHGGRPGSELKSVKLAGAIHDAQWHGEVDHTIYVFVNGGLLSHYDMPQQGSWGEWVFVKELIPHVDDTFRTIAGREGRGLEGFSQGGRGTARIMFKYPELFVSAAPGGGGHASEKRISESGGWENENLKFIKGANTWDRARSYDKHKEPKLNILVYVGDKGFNFHNNLEWTAFLKTLDIEHRMLIVPGAEHSAMKIYESHGLEIMRFHQANFGR